MDTHGTFSFGYTLCCRVAGSGCPDPRECRSRTCFFFAQATTVLTISALGGGVEKLEHKGGEGILCEKWMGQKYREVPPEPATLVPCSFVWYRAMELHGSSGFKAFATHQGLDHRIEDWRSPRTSGFDL